LLLRSCRREPREDRKPTEASLQPRAPRRGQFEKIFERALDAAVKDAGLDDGTVDLEVEIKNTE
jgi:hypothetical protein